MEAHSDPPRPLRPLANVAMASLGLILLANLVSLWVDLRQLGLANDLEDGLRVPFAELKANDDRVATTGLLQAGCYVVCAIAFLTWYGRAYRNLPRLGSGGLRYGQGIAIGSWFIPFMNWFRPKQVVNDIWRASEPGLPLGHRSNRDVPALLNWWWATWLISTFIQRIFFRSTVDDVNTPGEFVSLAKTYIAWDLVDIIPAILAILVIRTITARQEERRARFERGELREEEAAPLIPQPVEPSPIPMDLAPPAALDERLARRT